MNTLSTLNKSKASSLRYPIWMLFSFLHLAMIPSIHSQCVGVTPPTATLMVADRPCGESATGSLKLEIKGGLSPYALAWTIDNVSSKALPSKTETTQLVIENLISGMKPGYAVSIKDACGNSVMCDPVQLRNSPTISFVSEPKVVKQISNIGEQNGSICVELSGGNSPRELVATNQNGMSFSQQFPIGPPLKGIFKYVLENLPEGIYQIELKSGSKKCTQVWKETVVLKTP